MGTLRTIVLIVACATFASLRANAAEPTGPVSFTKDVAPVLLKQCQSCHGPEKSKGHYRLDSFDRLLKPGKSKSPVVTPGDAAHSELYRLIATSDADDRMPQDADALPAKTIDLIRRWIEQGATFDGPDRAASLASVAQSTDDEVEPPVVYLRAIPITAIAFSPDGKQLAANGYHEITLWNPADGKLLGRIKGLPERIWSIAWSPGGKQIAAAGGTPGLMGEVRICDSERRVPGRIVERISDMALAVRFSPDGKRLAAGGADNAVRVFDVDTGKRELLIEQHADWVTDLAFSPDGSKLVTASRDKSARVFDARTGEMLAAHLDHTEPIFGVAWSDDGARIYSVGRDRTMHVWNASDGKAADLSAEPTTKPAAKSNAKGKKGSGELPLCDVDTFKVITGAGLVFTCSADGTVRAFQDGKRSPAQTFPPASDWVYCIAFDPRSHRLAAGCHDGQVRVFDTTDPALLTHFTAAPGIQP